MLMINLVRPLCFVIVLALAVGCGTQASTTEAPQSLESNAETPPPALTETLTAQSEAERVMSAVPDVVRLFTITEDNDANNIIGRVNGYVAATVLIDSRITEGCDVAKPGIACGAGIEQWPDEAATQQRANYIKTLLSSAPILGTEYQTVKGNLLLRVSGKLKPSAAEAYQVAFEN
jgi:hypothetical protein